VRVLRPVWALGAALLLASCGYVGDPEPPALHIPVAVGDLAAAQRGDKILIQFTAPALTTDGLAVDRFEAVDLRIGAEGVQPFDRGRWEAASQQIEAPPPPGPEFVRVTTDAGPWAGREVILGVRLAGRKGRWSEFSNLFALRVVQPVKAPTDVAAEAVAAGVRVRWNSQDARPGVRYRIFRRPEKQEGYDLLGETKESEFVDTGTAYDASYGYRVQAVVAAGSRWAESDLTPEISITPRDVFPPAPPAGLRAIAGLDSVELAWERGDEPDLDSYRIYRAAEGEVETEIADGVSGTSFSDKDVRPGKRYRYWITAVDRLGNESARSAMVEQTAP